MEMTWQISILVFYIIGIFVNWYIFSHREDKIDIGLDEDSGLIEGLFCGLVLGPIAVLEAFSYFIISFGSWITTIIYGIYCLYQKYFTDEGRYKSMRKKYLHDIYDSIKHWVKYLAYKDIKIEHNHINIYYEDNYYLDTKNKKYVEKHINRAINNFPTVIPKYRISHKYVTGSNMKTRIDLQYTLDDYKNWKKKYEKVLN